MQERKGGFVIVHNIEVNEENVPFEVFGPILDFVYSGTVQYHMLPIELTLKVCLFGCVEPRLWLCVFAVSIWG